MSNVAVKIINLVKKFGNVTAVNNLNLDIYEGEIFGLLGPNGSGKTTTLLIITTVYKPTSGDVEIYGYSVTRHGDIVRRLVGIAFQEPKALWVDNPYELLLWHAMVVGYSVIGARRVIRDIMEELDLWEHRGKFISELSGGTRKKVEIAKLFIQKPKIAIFDEPTAQLDVTTKHRVWDKIKALRDEGSTIIVATNDMLEAERLADRIAIIHKGTLKALGTPSELKDRIPGGDIIELRVDNRIPDGIVKSLIEAIEARKLDYSDGVIRAYVNRGEEKIAIAIDILSRNNIKVKSVSLKEPTLDDVFFYFTGARLEEGRIQ
ncbi:MAG: ATP-binding cassette domain-containing protein [Acidilobaceae archaeon]